MCLCHQAV